MDHKKSAGRVERILKSIGFKCKYLDYNFLEREHDYAGFELECPKKFTEGLEKAINSDFSTQNGEITGVRLIDKKEVSDGRLVYILEIYPRRRLTKDKLAGATDEFLHSLPKAVKNYLMKSKKILEYNPKI